MVLNISYVIGPEFSRKSRRRRLVYVLVLNECMFVEAPLIYYRQYRSSQTMSTVVFNLVTFALAVNRDKTMNPKGSP